MKYLLSITLLATLILFSSANDDGAQCIKATRLGQSKTLYYRGKYLLYIYK